jgi:hypothetical protein
MPYAFAVISPRAVLEPGQPFTVDWALCAGGNEIVPAVLGVELVLPDGSTVSDPPAGLTGSINVNPGILGDRAAVVYRAGSLLLVLRLATADSRVFVTDVPYRVYVPTPVILSFSSPATRPRLPGPYPGDVRVAPWRTAYVVSCAVQSQLHFVTSNVDAVLFEVEAQRDALGAITGDPDGAFERVSSVSMEFEPAVSAAVAFPAITKSFVWLSDSTWLLTGPVLRGFLYRVEATATDVFGNRSAASSSGILRVEVEPSTEKENAAMAALRAMAAAAVAYILFAPAGEALRNLANGHGRQALDPPEPDRSFQELVKLQQPPDYSDVAERFPTLGKWLGVMQSAVFARDAMTAVEAKILGAIEAQDLKAEALQVNYYRKFAAALLDSTTRAKELAAAAAAEFVNQAQGADLPARLRAVQQGYVDVELDATLQKLFPSAGAAALARILGAIRGTAQGDLDLVVLLVSVTDAAASAASAAVRDAAERYAELSSARRMGPGGAIGPMFPASGSGEGPSK